MKALHHHGHAPHSGPAARGVALIIVLWMLVLLSIIAATLSVNARTETRLAYNATATAEARALARAGIEYARWLLSIRELRKHWPSDGSERPWQFADATILIRVQDQAGLIDLNHAPAELLHGLLATTDRPKSERMALVAAIQDWRDPDHHARPRGAEAHRYRAAGKTFMPRNAGFESVAELALVLGMTTELYAQVAPALTVHSGRAGVDPRRAPLAVLYAMPGWSRTAAEDYAASRRWNDAETTVPAPLLRYSQRSPDRVFGISAELKPEQSAARGRVAAIIRVRSKHPGEVLDWRE